MSLAASSIKFVYHLTCTWTSIIFLRSLFLPDEDALNLWYYHEGHVGIRGTVRGGITIKTPFFGRGVVRVFGTKD